MTKLKTKFTTELYFPCKHCGKWRRQHIGKVRKCLFEATVFEPKKDVDLTDEQRYALLERCDVLRKQLVLPLEKITSTLDMYLDNLHTAAVTGCPHSDTTAFPAINSPAGRVHVTCSLCNFDWYEPLAPAKEEPR